MTQIRREYRQMGTCRVCGAPAVQEVVIIPSWGEDIEQPGDVKCSADPTHRGAE